MRSDPEPVQTHQARFINRFLPSSDIEFFLGSRDDRRTTNTITHFPPSFLRLLHACVEGRGRGERGSGEGDVDETLQR